MSLRYIDPAAGGVGQGSGGPAQVDWGNLQYVQNGGWRIAYQQAGDRKAPQMVLIMGIGTQMIAWPDAFCATLIRRGYGLTRLDNRDVGLSSRGKHMPNIALHALMAQVGWPLTPEYRLADMAGDVVAVMDAVNASRAHVVGVSMGGMIGQHVASRHAARVHSLTAIMTSSGRPGLPAAEAGVRSLFMTRVDPKDREKWLAQRFKVLQAINSPAFPDSDEDLRAAVEAAYERGAPHGAGPVRQLVAILADGSRVRMLEKLSVPMLMLHGDRDPLIPVACGLDLAKTVPGCRGVVVKGMAHNLPKAISPLLAEEIAAFADGIAGPVRAQRAR